MLDAKIVEVWAAERAVQPKGIHMHRAVARWFDERVDLKPVDQLFRQDILSFKAKLKTEGRFLTNIKPVHSAYRPQSRANSFRSTGASGGTCAPTQDLTCCRISRILSENSGLRW